MTIIHSRVSMLDVIDIPLGTCIGRGGIGGTSFFTFPGSPTVIPRGLPPRFSSVGSGPGELRARRRVSLSTES